MRFLLALPLLLILGLFLILAFEVWMFIDAVQNPNISNDRRILWLVGMLFLHPIVAIAYYFTDHKLV